MHVRFTGARRRTELGVQLDRGVSVTEGPRLRVVEELSLTFEGAMPGRGGSRDAGVGRLAGARVGGREGRMVSRRCTPINADRKNESSVFFSLCIGRETTKMSDDTRQRTNHVSPP